MSERRPVTGLNLPPMTGGLKLPSAKAVGMSDTAAQQVVEQWNTIDRVDERLKKRGIHLNTLPVVACPAITAAALLAPDSKDYTVTYAAQLQWCNYVMRLLADVRAVLLQVQNEMLDIETKKRLDFRKINEGLSPKSQISATEMKDQIHQEPHYHDLKLQEQELEQEELKLKAWYEELERNLAVISRQVEVRKFDAQAGGRSQNLPNHASGRWEKSMERGAERAVDSRMGHSG